MQELERADVAIAIFRAGADPDQELLGRELCKLTADAPRRAAVHDHRCRQRAIGLEIDHDALLA